MMNDYMMKWNQYSDYLNILIININSNEKIIVTLQFWIILTSCSTKQDTKGTEILNNTTSQNFTSPDSPKWSIMYERNEK